MELCNNCGYYVIPKPVMDRFKMPVPGKHECPLCYAQIVAERRTA